MDFLVVGKWLLYPRAVGGFSSPNSARDPPSQKLLGEQGVSSFSLTQGKVLSL